jgi:hypothetical protein
VRRPAQFNDKGDIVTNNHVVTGSTTFTVTQSDGRKLPGTLVGTYPAGDLAVIYVQDPGLQSAAGWWTVRGARGLAGLPSGYVLCRESLARNVSTSAANSSRCWNRNPWAASA